jgi:vancomycin resistance protein VanW
VYRQLRYNLTVLFLLLLVVVGGYQVRLAYIAQRTYHRQTGAPTFPLLPPTQASRVSEDQLLWNNHPAFQAAIQAHHTPVLLAAFRIVLSDPIANESANAGLAMERLRGTVVAPGASFSINQALGPYTAENGYLPGPSFAAGELVITEGGGVCQIATLLYNLCVLSNLPIIYRQPHTMLVPYVPPGRDAAVSYTAGLDFRFRNNTAAPLLIWGQRDGEALTMAFYGRTAPPQVVWRHQTLSYEPQTTDVRYNAQLPAGEERVVTEGSPGYVIRNWAEVTYDDQRVEIRQLGVSSYRMRPRIVERAAP